MDSLPDSLAYGGREALAPEQNESDPSGPEDAWSHSLDAPPFEDAWAHSATEPQTIAEGDLLYHPKYEDAWLAWLIDNADIFLQKCIGLFGIEIPKMFQISLHGCTTTV